MRQRHHVMCRHGHASWVEELIHQDSQLFLDTLVPLA